MKRKIQISIIVFLLALILPAYPSSIITVAAKEKTTEEDKNEKDQTGQDGESQTVSYYGLSLNF